MFKAFVFLILSFGPFSQTNKYLDKPRESRLEGLTLISAVDFQSVNLSEIFGLEPNIPKTISLVEQSVPLFAGAMSNFFFCFTAEMLAWLKQKDKLVGFAVRRITTYPSH